jgi:iron complex transport system ATP-binding protein
MELKPIVEVRDLHFSYRDHSVLKGVDFALYPGDVVSLLGANGCGKSTLIRLILKLLHGKGDIWINGVAIQKYTHKDIAKEIAYIPQYHSVPFNYTVMEMVLMGRITKLGFFASPSAADKEAAFAALQKIGMEHLEKRPFGQLSGGQKQMVLLARAIAQEVGTFIMDEPVTGLDYGNQIRLLGLIDKLSAQGYTFLKTTHYPDHALLVSNRVVVMNEGKVILDGNAEEVVTSRTIKELYDIDADIITHAAHKRCVPRFEQL